MVWRDEKMFRISERGRFRGTFANRRAFYRDRGHSRERDHRMEIKQRRVPPRGFTLIELMLVVAIIALLTSIMLPSLGKAKGKAEQVACLKKIANLGVATHIYLAE